MSFSKRAFHHVTQASTHTGVRSEDYWAFKPGERVFTVDGFPGTVASVEDGPVAGTETYLVTLANEMGGGEYTTSQLSSVAEVTASEIHTADMDYPELGTALVDHPDIAPNKTASYTNHEQTCSDCNGTGSVPAQGHEPEDEVDNGQVQCPTCGGGGEHHEAVKIAEWGASSTNSPKRSPQPPCPVCGAGHDPALHEHPRSYCDICKKPGHPTEVHTREPYVEENPFVDSNKPYIRQQPVKMSYTIYGASNPHHIETFEGVEPADGGEPGLDDHNHLEWGGHSPGCRDTDEYSMFGQNDAVERVAAFDTEVKAGNPAAVSINNMFALDGPRKKWLQQQAASYTGEGGACHCGQPGHTWGEHSEWAQKANAAGTHDPWGRPKMQSYDGHGAWDCNNYDCAEHPQSLYPQEGQPQGMPGWLQHDTAPDRDQKHEIDKHFHETQGMGDADYLLDQQHQGPSKYSSANPQEEPDLESEEYRQGHSHHVSGEDVNCADLDHCPSICDHTYKKPCDVHRKDTAHDVNSFMPNAGWLLGLEHQGPSKYSSFDPWQILATAAGDPSFKFHVTAAWADVRKKAQRIVKDGGVHVTLATEGMVVAEVQGDHNTYESGLQRHPGRRNIAAWSCGCKWGSYHWGAADDFSRFAGRMCSHALALQYEAQSQGMFGQQTKVDTVAPRWVPTPRKVVVKYDIDEDRHVRAPGSSIPYSASKVAGVSFPQCRECGATDHHSGQHNFDEPTDHEHVAYVDDGITCRDCVDSGKAPLHRTDGKGRVSWNELRSKEVHGTDCDHCGKEITPPRPHTDNECEYGDDCSDLDPQYGEGHLHENDPKRATFGSEEDRKNCEDEQKFWNVAGPEQARQHEENEKNDTENAHHELGQVGTPEQHKFLDSNPTGPSKWSSLSVISSLIRYALNRGDQIGEVTLALHANGFDLPTVQAAVNNAWGEPDPVAVKNIPGPTKAPDPTDNPASSGWASGTDPDSWSQAGPSGINHMVANKEDRRSDMCQNCGQSIHDASGVDPNVPWVHAHSGNSYCDVHGTSDATLLAGSPLDRSEADPVFHESSLEEAIFEPVLADLHATPEPALPTTDSDTSNNPLGDAGDIGSPKSLEPESSSFVSTGALSVVEQFQASKAAQGLQGGSSADSKDIAGAAKEYLAKESLKAFTPSEQYQIINEGEGTKAANLDRLDLTGTHYTALEKALSAADEEDGEESWLA